jgi:hypothetical protein
MIQINILKKEMIKYLLSIIVIIIIIFILFFCIRNKIKGLSNNEQYKINDLIVDIEPNINKNLSILTDLEGLKSNGNKIKINNNGESSYKINILLCGNKSDYNIKIGINKSIIRKLNSLVYDNDCYIIYTDEISSKYYKDYDVKLWLNKNDYSESIKVKYNLKVEENKNDSSIN